MKRWIISFILLITVAYISSTAFSTLNTATLCADCHSREYNSYLTPLSSDMSIHREYNITCVECHSNKNIKGNIDAKKAILNLIILNKTYSLINNLFTTNYSFNTSDLSALRPNCIKCHPSEKIIYNHTNASVCEDCHFFHRKMQKFNTGLWRRMGEGAHRNLTCGDCHGKKANKPELPQCTKCHVTHLKGATWGRDTCLGCHANPHFPIKNAVFRGNITKEMCAACHNTTYLVLKTYDSRHNRNVPSCISCHPRHKHTKSCIECHIPHGPLHPGSNCNTCHRYVNACMDCHTNPHAPMSGLPTATGEALAEYAKERHLS